MNRLVRQILCTSLLLSASAAIAQTTLPPALPSAPPPARATQPPIAVALDLPVAPQPQLPSAAVTASLAAMPPRQLGHGVATPVSTGQPLKLSLDDAVRLGLERNLTVVADRQNERQIRGLQLTAFNALAPSLTATAQTETQQINLAAMGFKAGTLGTLLPPGFTIKTIVKVDTTSAQLNLSQQLFNLPAFEIYRAAKATVDQSKLQTLLDRGSTVQTIATQYLRILADTATIHNAESQLVRDQALEYEAQARKDAGVGTNLDYLRARVQRQNREQQLIASNAAFQKDKIQLNRAMGLAADQPIELTDAVPYHEIETLPLDKAKQVADKRRTDLLSLRAQLRSAELQRRAIAYERLPAATLGGYYGVLGETHGLYHGNFVVQGGINFPIFEEARIRGDRVVADAQLSRLRSQIRSLQADIEQQLRSSMLDLTTASELVKDATSNVDLATEALDESQLRYRAGVEDNLPVVRAQATLAEAQAELVSSLFQFNRAKLQLARNTGVIESQYDSYLGD